MKDILANLGYISKEKLLIETHKLDKLINLLEKFSKKYFDENKERIGALLLIKDIDACISIIKKEMSDFINFDNYSLTFRYPYYKNGIHTIKEPITFNAKKMYDSVLVCRNQLTKISTQLICDDNNPRFEKRV